MPQALYPQPPDGSFSYRPRALVSQRPGHAAGIGAVSAEWAALEEYLTLAMVRSLLAFSDEGAYSCEHDAGNNRKSLDPPGRGRRAPENTRPEG